MDFQHSARSRDLTTRVETFIRRHILPVEERILRETREAGHGGDWTRWSVSPVIEDLKVKARAEGLWNLFLPDEKRGAGLTTLDYAPVAEAMGHSLLAPEIFNCNAPDSGNMEVLDQFGSEEQKRTWLEPLLAGEIRSAFLMSEPDVASSDATNIRSTITIEGQEMVLNGRKWWSTGTGHPHARFAIFLGRSNPDAGRHQQHSMVIVPLDAPGVKIERMLPVFDDYDAPYGHGEVTLTNVRLAKSHLIAGEGKGFEIAQGRLGPGRIHHCMRAIGAAERVLAMMITRASSRTAFGKPLLDLGGNRERIAGHRIAIDQARLLTLHAAWRLDQAGPLGARSEVSAIKVAAPNVLQRIVDDAMQIFGGAGLSNDVPLTKFFALARALRIADGPDEVHLALIARLEIGKHRHE